MITDLSTFEKKKKRERKQEKRSMRKRAKKERKSKREIPVRRFHERRITIAAV